MNYDSCDVPSRRMDLLVFLFREFFTITSSHLACGAEEEGMRAGLLSHVGF